jgi:hypothetical protein
MGRPPSWALWSARNCKEPCRAHPSLGYWARWPLLLQLPRGNTGNCRTAPGMLGLPLSCHLQKSKPGLPHAALLRDEGGKEDMERVGIETSGI